MSLWHCVRRLFCTLRQKLLLTFTSYSDGLLSYLLLLVTVLATSESEQIITCISTASFPPHIAVKTAMYYYTRTVSTLTGSKDNTLRIKIALVKLYMNYL
jgi:hypothetical protein